MYLAMYMKANPHEVTFLHLRRQVVVIHVDADQPDWPSEGHQEFQWRPLEVFRQDQVPLDPNGQLVVTHGCRFEGELVVSDHSPLFLEDYFMLCPEPMTTDTAPATRRGRRKIVTFDERQELMAAHPHLEPGDFKEAGAPKQQSGNRERGVKRPRSSGETSDSDSCTDDEIDELSDGALEAMCSQGLFGLMPVPHHQMLFGMYFRFCVNAIRCSQKFVG